MNMQQEAQVKFGHNDIQLVSPGAFVRCAVTGDPIDLNDLRYWSVDKQEAYRDAESALHALHD